MLVSTALLEENRLVPIFPCKTMFQMDQKKVHIFSVYALNNTEKNWMFHKKVHISIL